jgi:CheY-like chemotaxis protein
MSDFRVVSSGGVEVIDPDAARAARLAERFGTRLPAGAGMYGGVVAFCQLGENQPITNPKAPIGSLAYLYRETFRGKTMEQSGPVLLWGPFKRRILVSETERIYGVSVLSLPGVEFHQTVPHARVDLDRVVEAYAQLARAWFEEPGPAWKMRKRNQLLVTGIFRILRSAVRPLLHSLNSPVSSELPSSDAVESLSKLCGEADELLRLPPSPSRNGDGEGFVGAVARLTVSHADRDQITAALEELDRWVVWWEALLAWSAMAHVVRREQAVHIVSMDDEKPMRDFIASAVEHPDFSLRLAQESGRRWRQAFHRLDEGEDPADVVAVLKKRGLLRADRTRGSEVVVLQDISLFDDPDRGQIIIRRLRSNYPWIHIVAVTVRERIRFELLDAGADAYLSKRDFTEPGSHETLSGASRSSASALLAEIIGGLLAPGVVLQLGTGNVSESRAFRLLCRRYRLYPDPIQIAGTSLEEIWERMEASSPPRLLIIGWDPEFDGKISRSAVIVRELCTVFPDLVVLLAAPPPRIPHRDGPDAGSSRWFEHWRRWIPNFSLRVIPVEQTLNGSVRYPGVSDEGRLGDRAFLFTAPQLATFDTMMRVGEAPTSMAAFRFLIPLSLKQNPTEPDPALKDDVMHLAREISEHYGGSSTHEIRGRWLDEHGEECHDINLSIEAIAPATHANRLFAERLVNEIRIELNQHAVLQIESPVAMVARESLPAEALAEGLCSANGVVDGSALLGVYREALEDVDS